eukprot:TRINITY_DN123863_c0_g1_i1.p1 TRINITY_DN123863_c0_g1~~TRINITY_DN123863_c0_g1_i1.p1  ORF type:complete len:651 (-),score=141.04 TRINITY_DN123863_c0_g1_i1:250-2202(-)
MLMQPISMAFSRPDQSPTPTSGGHFFPLPLVSASPAASRPIDGGASCSCCRAVAMPAAGSLRQQDVQALRVLADPAEIGRAAEADLDRALMRVFGPEGLQALFGVRSTMGARRLRGGGLNHAFMVGHAGRLLKCVRPQTPICSEAAQAVKLRTQSPGLVVDVHAVFPLATFLCEQGGQADQAPYELLVFPWLDGCRPVSDLVRMFEKSHQTGSLRATSSCEAYRATGRCEHIRQLEAILTRQAAFLNGRFQGLHGRRHGDYKANNLLLCRDGMLRVADFLTPFCTSCDREEFLSSSMSMHAIVKDFRAAAAHGWERYASAAVKHLGAVQASALGPADVAGNARLLAALESFTPAVDDDTPLLGPAPILRPNSSISLTLPIGSSASTAPPSTVESFRSAPKLLRPGALSPCGKELNDIDVEETSAPSFHHGDRRCHDRGLEAWTDTISAFFGCHGGEMQLKRGLRGGGEAASPAAEATMIESYESYARAQDSVMTPIAGLTPPRLSVPVGTGGLLQDLSQVVAGGSSSSAAGQLTSSFGTQSFQSLPPALPSMPSMPSMPPATLPSPTHGRVPGGTPSPRHLGTMQLEGPGGQQLQLQTPTPATAFRFYSSGHIPAPGNPYRATPRGPRCTMPPPVANGSFVLPSGLYAAA